MVRATTNIYHTQDGNFSKEFNRKNLHTDPTESKKANQNLTRNENSKF